MIKIENLWIDKNDVYFKVEKRATLSAEQYAEYAEKEYVDTYGDDFRSESEMEECFSNINIKLIEKLGKNMTVIYNKHTDKELIVVEKVPIELLD